MKAKKSKVRMNIPSGVDFIVSKHTEGINPRELRIGNLIYSCKPKFKDIRDYVLTKVSSEYIDYIDKAQLLVKPIPINQKELFDFGFKRKGTSNVYWKDTYGVDLGTKIYFIQRSNTNKHTFWIRTELKYIHTLQNIFYALTNKELNNENN